MTTTTEAPDAVRTDCQLVTKRDEEDKQAKSCCTIDDLEERQDTYARGELKAHHPTRRIAPFTWMTVVACCCTEQQKVEMIPSSQCPVDLAELSAFLGSLPYKEYKRNKRIYTHTHTHTQLGQLQTTTTRRNQKIEEEDILRNGRTSGGLYVFPGWKMHPLCPGENHIKVSAQVTNKVIHF